MDYEIHDESNAAPKRRVLKFTSGDFAQFQAHVSRAIEAANSMYASKGVKMDSASSEKDKEIVVLVLWDK